MRFAQRLFRLRSCEEKRWRSPSWDCFGSGPLGLFFVYSRKFMTGFTVLLEENRRKLLKAIRHLFITTLRVGFACALRSEFFLRYPAKKKDGAAPPGTALGLPPLGLFFFYSRKFMTADNGNPGERCQITLIICNFRNGHSMDERLGPTIPPAAPWHSSLCCARQVACFACVAALSPACGGALPSVRARRPPHSPARTRG